MSNRPNIVPICLTTGIGPHGHELTFPQDSNRSTGPSTPALPTGPSPTTPDPSITMNSLLEGLNANPNSRPPSVSPSLSFNSTQAVPSLRSRPSVNSQASSGLGKKKVSRPPKESPFLKADFQMKKGIHAIRAHQSEFQNSLSTHVEYV